MDPEAYGRAFHDGMIALVAIGVLVGAGIVGLIWWLT